jgi:hypothetical protein
MRRYEPGSPDFERQTAIMDALPHAIHPMHGDWRTKADALLDGLQARGWTVVPLSPAAAAPVSDVTRHGKGASS